MATETEEQRGVTKPPISLASERILEYFGSSQSAAGIYVTPQKAMMCSPVFQAVNLITSDVARLPMEVKQVTPDGRGSNLAMRHPLYKVLRRWTGESTPNIWISRLLGHALLYGNGYTRIIWRGARVEALRWYKREQVKPNWKGGRFFYEVMNDPEKDGTGAYEWVQPDDMVHIQGLTLDEFGGLSIVDFARETIGRHLAAEGFTSDFFNNDARPVGYFQHPAQMSQEAQERFMASMERRHQGVGNRWRSALLEEGMQYNAVGINPKDALLLELMDFGVDDVARFFNLPPHKLGSDKKVSYNSLEQENKAYFDSTLGHWVSRIECELNAKLLLDPEIDDGYFIQARIDDWNRADTAARYQAYSVAIQWGIMSRNEVRQIEGMNPYEGGDEYLTPLTHGSPADPMEDEPADEEELPADTPPPDTRQRVILRDLLIDRMEAAARLLVNSLTRAVKRESNFLAQINSLRDKHGAAVQGMITAAATAGGADCHDIADRMFGRTIDLMLSASECSPDLLPARVADAGESLRQWCVDTATDLIFGDHDNGNAND